MEPARFLGCGDGERVVLVAARHLALEVPQRPPQGSVAHVALPVIPSEQGVVILLRFKKQFVFQAVVQNDRVDAASHEIIQNSVVIAVQLWHEKFSGWGRFGGGMRNGRQYCRPPNKRFHRLGKRKALDFNEIVQGRLAADPTGKPVPFPVADFQTVMLTGAIGAAADVYQFMEVIPLEVGQQVKLFRLSDLFRRDITHLPSLPLARRPKPVSLPVVQRGSQFLDCHGASAPFLR